MNANGRPQSPMGGGNRRPHSPMNASGRPQSPMNGRPQSPARGREGGLPPHNQFENNRNLLLNFGSDRKARSLTSHMRRAPSPTSREAKNWEYLPLQEK